jgi:hypothetical protein
MFSPRPGWQAVRCPVLPRARQPIRRWCVLETWTTCCPARWARHQKPGAGLAAPSRAGWPLPAAGEWPDVALIYRQHHADLVRLALLLVGDRACAEDVVQDVFTRLCTRGRVLAQDSALAYVRTAVVNGCRSVLRRQAVARRIAVTRAAPWPSRLDPAVTRRRHGELRAAAGRKMVTDPAEPHAAWES